MRTVNSTAFKQVQDIVDILPKLQLDTKSGLYLTPYREKTIVNQNINKETIVYDFDDIAFVNTAEFSKTGREFLRTGKYTQAHPRFDKAEYDAFWDEEERRCKEGLTLPGKLTRNEKGELTIQQVHITGEHYGYLNYGEIKRSKEFENKKGAIYSAGGEPLVHTEKGGHSKEFSLPAFWDGDYYFFKAVELCRKIGKHLVVGKARRKGYSYKNGWLVANRANLYRRSTSVVGAYDAGSLFDDGTMVKVLNYLDFLCKHTDWNKRRLHNTLEHIEIGFRYKGEDVKRGFLSNIYTAILKTNPGGMRGKDADLLLLEEAGKCPNLSDILAATLKTLTDGEFMTGLMIIFGTGGGDDNQWQGFEDLFYDPQARRFIEFINKWDDDMSETGCGYFHPSFMNRPGLIDQFGNSDIIGSLKSLNEEKESVKHSPTKLNELEMEEPEKPSQAFSRTSNNIFNPKEVDNHLKRLLHDPKYKGIGREGVFVVGNEGVQFKERKLFSTQINGLEVPPYLVNYPLRGEDSDVRGCWVLWEQPYRDKFGKIPKNLYHLWNDPFGISKDKEEFKLSDSLGCTYIYEATNNFTPTKGDRIIGCYIGRTEDSADYDDQMFLGALYFNAEILFENDRGNVYGNAKAKGYLHLLKDEPTFQYNKELAKGGMGRKKGISIGGNSGRKANGLVYLKDWLFQKRGIDIHGNPIYNLHYVYDVGLLKELLKFTKKGNFDRISTMIVGMYDIKEQIHNMVVPKETAIKRDSYFSSFRE